ncbi:MAG: phosphomannomutase/phosphoglucomutase [Actinomycetota bacterium]|nr:phosphomannomutase/phosphoglucomutase [Actinomycetota bacterium]MDQ2981770.1 phosphomannomutase/phosphoglucomutase [Actinomycetota bacterium]
MLDPKVFKAYDVRGIYPSELDEEGAYAIGRAFVVQFEPRKIAVGHDMRVSSPSMAEAVIRGASEAGADVLDLGLVGTEMVYFAVGELGLDGGIEVTASHNPKEYTGMKIVRRGALPVGGESGLLEIRDRALSLSDVPGGQAQGQTPGQVQTHDIWEQYVERVLSFVDLEAIAPLKIVIDAANGMAGAMLPPVLERLPRVETVRCFFEPDGTFPNHEPNPLLPENRELIVRKTLEEQADFGVAFDGDADRCFFVDDSGEFVPGDFVTALLAEAVLEREPGAKVIYDLRASWAVPETIERAGGIPLVNRVGHAFIKHRMREEDAAFGGEVSGHYYFRDFSQADSGVVPFLLMLELVSKRGEKLSGILGPFRETYFITGELNTPVPDVAVKLQELKERFGSEGRVSHLDGVSVDAEDWHMNVRPSNTEPLLRLNLEARTREQMERKRDEVLEVIRS